MSAEAREMAEMAMDETIETERAGSAAFGPARPPPRSSTG